MTKIYVVENGYYSDRRVVAIFSAEEMAEQYAKTLDDPTVTGWELDSLAPNGRERYSVAMTRNGDAKWRCVKDGNPFRQSTTISLADNGDTQNMGVDCWAKDAEHAVKIAGEHRRALIAAGEWPEKKE
jgi:hypothetical protein